MDAGTSTSSYASLKKNSPRILVTSSPARRTSLGALDVTRKPLSQLGRGGGEVSCVSRPSGMAILNVRLEDMVGAGGRAARGERVCVSLLFLGRCLRLGDLYLVRD